MMRRVFVLISLVVAILVIMGNVFAQDETSKASIPEPSLDPAEWKLVFTDSDGSTVYVNTRRINYLPGGIVEVWTLSVLRGEGRQRVVNDLKKNLNDAERFWYIKSSYKINCRTRQFALLEAVVYSFEETVLGSYSSQYEKWNRIGLGSPMESVEKFVCK